MFWFLAISITVIACLALFYAARRQPVNAQPAEGAGAAANPLTVRNRAYLRNIEEDLALGRIAPTEGAAAKAELAREMIRQKAEQEKTARAEPAPAWVLPGALALVAAISFGTYWALGSPDLPTRPLAARADLPAPAPAPDMQSAVAEVEAHLAEQPDDARGWQVLAPIYMQSGRFAEAVTAFENINRLLPPTADSQTNLAEALLMQDTSANEPRALELLRSAAASDPNHVRSRFYLAGNATAAGDFVTAAILWRETIALAEGGEPWLETAREGLAFAQSGGTAPATSVAPATPAPFAEEDREMILGMVENLATRLADEGGTVEEWARLVRAQLVLDDRDAAAAAYADAVKAYPDPNARPALDAMAAEAGLTVTPETTQ